MDSYSLFLAASVKLVRSNIYINTVTLPSDDNAANGTVEIGFQVRFSPALTKTAHLSMPWITTPGNVPGSYQDYAENYQRILEEVRGIRQGAEQF